MPETYPQDLAAQWALRLVAPDLAIGSAQALPKFERVWAGVIDLHGAADTWPEREAAFARAALHGRVLRWPAEDGQRLPSTVFDAALAIYESAGVQGGSTLVMCLAGKSRSVSVAYALLRAVHDLSHEDALARVQLYPSLWPHPVTLESAVRWVRSRRG